MQRPIPLRRKKDKRNSKNLKHLTEPYQGYKNEKA
jgi:hypothetical protein